MVAAGPAAVVEIECTFRNRKLKERVIVFRDIRCVACAVVCLAISLPAACSCQGGSEKGEYRTFTDNRGRTVQARVLRVDGDEGHRRPQ